MALEFAARKTEHNGAKNSGHDKVAPRSDLKEASKKLRRRADKAVAEDEAFARHAREAMDRYPIVNGYMKD